MKSIPIIGTKSTLLWDEDTDAWVYVSGEPVRGDSPRDYYRAVPTLYRAVDIRASTVAGLPWRILQGKNEYDSSDNYCNRAGLVNNMYNLLYLIESSLVLSGSAYLKREKNPAGYDKLRHLDPTSLVLDEKAAKNGEIIWKRREAFQQREYTPKEIVYFWYPDPYVEIGPPSSCPAKAAINACGVLVNLDDFVQKHFKRGAIKAMLFAMQGAPRGEAEKFEHWWNKYISGIKNAFRTKVINADKVNPVVVGEGIKELENITLSQEKREEIALAFSIPMSILFSNSANYATAERDKLNWYEDKVVPEANFIAGVLNEQVFKPLGLYFEFIPETLDIFQEDEAARATAMSQFMDAIDKAGDFEMAQALFDIYGVEVSDDAMSLIQQHFEGKKERSNQMLAQLAGQNSAPENTKPEQEQEEQEEQEEKAKRIDDRRLQAELSRWQAKCLAALKRGEAPSTVSFVPVSIPLEQYRRIITGLAEADSEEAVKELFARASAEELPIALDPMMMIALELKRANDLLASTPKCD